MDNIKKNLIMEEALKQITHLGQEVTKSAVKAAQSAHEASNLVRQAMDQIDVSVFLAKHTVNVASDLQKQVLDFKALRTQDTYDQNSNPALITEMANLQVIQEGLHMINVANDEVNFNRQLSNSAMYQPADFNMPDLKELKESDLPIVLTKDHSQVIQGKEDDFCIVARSFFNYMEEKMKPSDLHNFKGKSESHVVLTDIIPVQSQTIQKDKSVHIPKKPQRPFSELGSPLSKIFQALLTRGYLRPMNPKPIPHPLPKKFRVNQYCDYHQGPGHLTDECFALRHVIQDLIEQGVVNEATIWGNGSLT